MERGFQRLVCLAVSSAIVLAGCATSSKDIAPSYVSPMQYTTFDCEQLNAEGQRIQGKVVQLGGRLDEAANNDKALAAVGAVLFWPALFFLGGTKQQEAEYARLKGEYDAVQQALVQKRCTAATQQPNAASTGTMVATSAAPAAVSTAAASGQIGQAAYEVAQIGRQNNCDPNSQARLMATEGSVEFYSYQCNAQDTWTLRCEFSSGATAIKCRNLK